MLGIGTFTGTEVLVQLLESASPGAAYPWPSFAPWRRRERLWPRRALWLPGAGLGQTAWRSGCVSPRKGGNAQLGGCSCCLPSQSCAESCVMLCVCGKAGLGLTASISCFGEPLAWESGTPQLVASWHGDMQDTKRTFGKKHTVLKGSGGKTCMHGT